MALEFAHVDDLMVSCHSPGLMAADEWNSYMEALRQKSITRYLGTALGRVEPNSVQRSELFAFFHKRHIKVGVVTDDQLVRGIATAASWVGVDVRAFPWVEVRSAIQYLGVTDQTSITRVEKQVFKLRQSLEHFNSTVTRRAV
jgi:hypothetical protein